MQANKPDAYIAKSVQADLSPGASACSKISDSVSSSTSSASAPTPTPLSVPSSPPGGAVAPQLTVHDRAKALIKLQSFEGSFSLTSQLAAILDVSLTDLQAKLAEITTGQEKEKLWATVLALCLFEGKLMSEKAMWELVVEKARDWISTIGNKDVEKLEGLAREMLGV